MVWLIVLMVLTFVLVALEMLMRFAVVRRRAELHVAASAGLTEWDRYRREIEEGERWIAAQRMETVSIQSDDGLKLAGRYLDAGTRRTLLLFHGYRSRADRDFSCVVQLYHEMGFNVLLVDQRAHGESEGKYICFGVKEKRDCLRWAEYIDRRVGGDLFLDGISMGATTVLMAAGETLPASVRGIIADCGFTSPREIMRTIMKRDMHLPDWPLLSLMRIYVRLRTGFDIDGYSTLTAMKQNHIPVLLVHGKADAFVPYEMSVAAYEACAAEKQLVLVEGAGHGTSYLKDGPRCRAALTEFLNKYSMEK